MGKGNQRTYPLRNNPEALERYNLLKDGAGYTVPANLARDADTTDYFAKKWLTKPEGITDEAELRDAVGWLYSAFTQNGRGGMCPYDNRETACPLLELDPRCPYGQKCPEDYAMDIYHWVISGDCGASWVIEQEEEDAREKHHAAALRWLTAWNAMDPADRKTVEEVIYGTMAKYRLTGEGGERGYILRLTGARAAAMAEFDDPWGSFAFEDIIGADLIPKDRWPKLL